MLKDDLRITEPCHADWNAMKRGEKSRFCGDCKKAVHDLSKLTRGEAKALLATPPTEGLCVRYLHDDLGHVAFVDTFRDRPVPVTSLLRKVAKSAATAALLAFPLSLTACMGAMQSPPPRAVPTPAQEVVDVGNAPAASSSAEAASDGGVPLAK